MIMAKNNVELLCKIILSYGSICRFHCQAHNFSNQLYHILKRRENGCSVHESHMQALFEAFACMFGLQSGLR